MFSRTGNGLSNPALATRYIGRKSLDKIFNAFPACWRDQAWYVRLHIDIIEGAQMAIDHATFVYIKCSLVDYNKGAPQLI